MRVCSGTELEGVENSVMTSEEHLCPVSSSRSPRSGFPCTHVLDPLAALLGADAFTPNATAC